MNIYVGNVPPQATDNELRAIFEEFGEVTSARIIKDRFSGESRGFAFVEMASKNEGINAINSANGRELNGYQITVNEARPREEGRGPRSSGGQGGRGGQGGGNSRRW